MSQIHVAQPSLELSGQYTLTMLFEKELTATDVGRVGRLIIPKANAEVYFPPLEEPGSIPLTIHDVKGNEWTFHFKLFLSNKSNIYALAGRSVTAFMKSMQLQAGDFVTFYRSVPDGKLVMGYYHKASNSTAIQGPLQLCSPSGRKRVRKSGAESKPLLNDSVVDSELKINWEEAQELLRSPQSERSFVVLDDEVIEEFDELPVFGKKSVFVSRETGEQEQWVKCDTCEKWRRVPVDTLLPPNWSCSDNLLDPVRSSCSAPDEDSPRELIQQIQESKRKRFESSNEELNQVREALDSVTTENVGIIITDREGENTVAATTNQPRNQAQCSCTICSHPLIAKGKHEVSCTCNVCETRKGQCKTMEKRCRTPRIRKRQRGEAGPSQLVQSEIRDETQLQIIPAVEPAAVSGEARQTSQQAQSEVRDKTQLQIIPAVEPAAVRGEAVQTMKKRSLRMRKKGDAGQTSQQAQSKIRDETQLQIIPAVEPAAVRGEAGQIMKKQSLRMQKRKREDAEQTSRQVQSGIRDETHLQIIPAVEPASVRGLAGQTSHQAHSEIRDETQLQIVPAVEPAAVRNIDLNSAPVENIDLNSAPVENIDLNSDPVENIDLNSAPVRNFDLNSDPVDD